MTIIEFLLARIAEDEAVARASISSQADPENGWGLIEYQGMAGLSLSPHVGHIHERVQGEHITRWNPARVLAECEAKRRIVELHKAWPVLVQQPPEFENFSMSDDLNSMTARMSQRMKWMTEQEYRARFTDEPPTAPMIRVLAAVYADHPDYDEAWRC